MNTGEGAPSTTETAEEQGSGYRYGRRHYAAAFDQTPRTINRWIAHGKAKGELPPLDDPAQMPAWWVRHMKHRPPAAILVAVSSAEVNPSFEEKSASVTGDTPSALLPVIPAAVPAALGMGGALLRMRLAESEAAIKYLEAQRANPPNEADIEMRRRAWERMTESLRKLEKDSPGVLKESGDLLPRDEVIQELTQILSVVGLTWRSFAKRLFPRLQGLSVDQADQLWNLESDKVFEKLKIENFASVVSLESDS